MIPHPRFRLHDLSSCIESMGRSKQPSRSRVGRPISGLLRSDLAGTRRFFSGKLFERVIWIDGWLLRLAANGVSGDLFYGG